MHDKLRPGIAPPPPHMANRPIHRGYPVPYFVAWVDGVPDFRVVDAHKFEMCRKFEFCWLCGKPLGGHRVFVIGPMCVVNRTTSEPPSHMVCATYAAENCPHIVHPEAKRRAANLPEGHHEPGGHMVRQNPGLVALWESKTYSYYRPKGGGILVDIGKPVSVSWWTEGRQASRDEAVKGFTASVERLKLLTADMYADNPGERDKAFLELGRQTGEALKYLPAA